MKIGKVAAWAAILIPGILVPLERGSSQAASQRTGRIAFEGRVDALIAENRAIHAGLGVTAYAGTYLRTGLVAGLGRSEAGISGRLDLIGRFHLDPFRESRWAPYAGGGLNARFEDHRSERLYLLVFAGLDGPVSRGLTTAFEAGFGGGGRIGIVLRQAGAERR